MQDFIKTDLIVVGGGPAGLAAALEAHKQGIMGIVIIERDKELGGILPQCIHTGFGLGIFGEELTGPEYAERFVNAVEKAGIKIYLNTLVLDLYPDEEKSGNTDSDSYLYRNGTAGYETDYVSSHINDYSGCIKSYSSHFNNYPNHPNNYMNVIAVNTENGIMEFSAKAVILAMGCREKTRGALIIPGTRPAGIFTAGTAQRFVNIEGYMPGKKAVILGSGDIGLIMARRMTLEGAEVRLVCELMPHSGGLTRNIVQCLEDFNIPLKYNCTVTEIHGKERLEGVTISDVDENRKPVPGTSKYIECDTLLLSVGLIPENELSGAAGILIDPVTLGPVVDESTETSINGVFACGNVLHVHDLVDFVTEESRLAGRSAARYIAGFDTCANASSDIDNDIKKGIKKVIKKGISKDINKDIKKDIIKDANRDMQYITCVVCPLGCDIKVSLADGRIVRISGNKCKRGIDYALAEIVNPTRVLTTTVKIKGAYLPLIPVKSDIPIPKKMLFDCMKIINSMELSAPVKLGARIIENILGTGANIVATRTMNQIA